MSAQLAIVKDDTSLASANFQSYLKANLTSDLVLQVLEECLLQENNTYGSLDFEQTLKDIEQQDGSRYMLLKVLLEGYATKQGLVMLDPKLVTASYKQRMAELELLKSMGRFRRFFYRLVSALTGLLTEKNETQAIQEAIQLTGEVQIARNELATLELKKSQAQRDADKILTETSSQARVTMEVSNQRATEKTEEIYRESRRDIQRERMQAVGYLRTIEQKIKDAETTLMEHENRAKKILTSDDLKKYNAVLDRVDHQPRQVGRSGVSGFSGYSGTSRISGTTGYSGISSTRHKYGDGSGALSDE